MLQSDLAVSLTLFWFVVVPIFAGVAVADLPEDKELFTWKSYIGPFLASQVWPCTSSTTGCCTAMPSLRARTSEEDQALRESESLRAVRERRVFVTCK